MRAAHLIESGRKYGWAPPESLGARQASRSTPATWGAPIEISAFAPIAFLRNFTEICIPLLQDSKNWPICRRTRGRQPLGYPSAFIEDETLMASVLNLLFGRTPQLRRLMLYWASTSTIYLLAELIIWLLVLGGDVSPATGLKFGLFMAGGVCFFYLMVRLSGSLGLAPSVLTVVQGVFAIIVIVSGYVICGRFRGATLSILVVMMSFCGFALSVRQSIALSAFSLLVLGGSIVWISHADPLGHPPLLELTQFVLACGMLVAVVFLTAQWNRLRGRLKSQKLELACAFQKIQLLASNDDLTRLPNRRYMNTVLGEEERRSDRSTRSMCLALIDIDHFKRINDAYGHAVGDEVLQAFATHLKDALRTEDVLARWGGEEFMLLLPDTTEEIALHVLARIQSQLCSITGEGDVGNIVITFSGGLTAIGPEERIADAVRRADSAMFQAKSEGRNTIRCYKAEVTPAARK